MTATIPVGSEPVGWRWTPPSASSTWPTGSATVSVINAATHTVTATIPVGSQPVGVAVDSSAGTVYVANYW